MKSEDTEDREEAELPNPRGIAGDAQSRSSQQPESGEPTAEPTAGSTAGSTAEGGQAPEQENLAGRASDDPVIETPVDPLDPWRILGTENLPEGQGWALLLRRPDGPVVEVILCRVDGALLALDSTCPHAGGRIQGGELVEGRYARCPLHWFDFDPQDGRCVNVDCDPAATLRVEERDGVGLLWLAD